MAEPGPPAAGLTDDERDSIEAVAAFHAEHAERTGRLQALFNAATSRLGRPTSLVVLGLVLVGGIALAFLGGLRIEDPLFAWLELAATVAALLVAMLILVTQRHEDLLAERRARLTLELALLADRKNAKIIALLEELRRDAPDLADRRDAESEAMATPADLQAVAAATEQAPGPGPGPT